MRHPEPSEPSIREYPETDNFPFLSEPELARRCAEEREHWPPWRWELELRRRGEWVEIMRGRVSRTIAGRRRGRTI